MHCCSLGVEDEAKEDVDGTLSPKRRRSHWQPLAMALQPLALEAPQTTSGHMVKPPGPTFNVPAASESAPLTMPCPAGHLVQGLCPVRCSRAQYPWRLERCHAKACHCLVAFCLDTRNSKGLHKLGASIIVPLVDIFLVLVHGNCFCHPRCFYCGEA